VANQASEYTSDAPHRLQGALVRLRPVEFEDLSLLHRWRNDAAMAGPFANLPPASLTQVQRRYNERPTFDLRGGDLLIVCRADEQPVGTVQFHRVGYSRSSPVENIGIMITPERRGQGYGAEAQRLLADYLLLMFPIARVEASTEVENIAEQRALEKAGFLREGVARSVMWRAGRWRDMVVYSRIRGDA
jgi:RimJ/RimL family protein N-acetyltransferase